MMKKNFKILVVFFFFMNFSIMVFAKPNITILATGGTIAGVGQSNIKSTYTSGCITVDALINAVPKLSKIANVKGEQISNIGSQEMNNDVWLKLGKRINKILLSTDVDGVVVTHGTDTLEETAYFLNLIVHSRKPVVLVGSMRSSTSMSADGPLNIYNAVSVAIASSSYGKGVLVVMNDNIHAAREVTKTNTSNVATFQSPDFGIIGYVYYGKVNFYRESTKRHTYKSEFYIDDIKKFPQVEIIYGYSNNTEIFVDAAVKNNVKGIIHAGVGNGNIYPKTLNSLIKARKKNVIIVRSSRVGSGRTMLECEVDDVKNGFVVADNLNAQKSKILLMLALTKTKNIKEIQRIFFDY